MRVGVTLFSRDDMPSGVEYYAMGLIQALQEPGMGCEVVVYTNRSALLPPSVAASPRVRVKSLQLPGRAGRIVWEQLLLARQATRDRLDVVHCTSYIAPLSGCAVPCVVTVHDTFALDEPGWCSRANHLYYRTALVASIRSADAVVVPSNWTAVCIKRRVPAAATKLHVVYPGLDPAFSFSQDADRLGRVRRKYDLPRRYILHVGNLEPRKNLVTLLQAHGLLRPRGHAIDLVLAGGRVWRGRGLLRELARAKRVRRVGYVARRDLPAFYSMSEAYICPSLAEGFGFPVLEAMASGVAVVHSGGGALIETVADAGLLVDASNPGALAAGIGTVLDDPLARQDLIARGQRRATGFDWARSAKKMRRVYEHVTSGRRQCARELSTP